MKFQFRIPCQAMQWELRGYKRKPGQARKNWMDIVRRDLKDMGTSWDEAEELETTEQNGVNAWPNVSIWM